MANAADKGRELEVSKDNQAVVPAVTAAGKVVDVPVSVAEKGRDLPAASTTPAAAPAVTPTITEGEKKEQPTPWGGLIDWDAAAKEGLQYEDIANDPTRFLRNKEAKWNSAQMIADHARWEKSQGRTPDYMRYTSWAMNKDLSKNPMQDEADRKREKRNAMWEQVGYALMNLGNFVGSAAWGAPSPEKAPDSVELTKRQQALRDKSDALRNAYNKNFFENYWKQRAQENADKTASATEAYRQWQIQSGKAKDAREDASNKAQVAAAEALAEYRKEQTETARAKRPEEVNLLKSRQKQAGASAAASYARAYASQQSGDTQRKNRNIYTEHAKNMEDYPEETKTFMKDHNIHGRGNKDWTDNQIKQYNAMIDRKRKNGVKPAAKPSTSKTDYSKYKVKK